MRLPLPLSRAAFKQVLAARARRADHSGGLEASAVVLGMRRLARQQRLHSHRGCFLVDAQAVLGALKKGRSSAGTLRHPVAQAGALALACNWKLTFGYLPSESNPADDLSRGVLQRGKRKRKRPATVPFSKQLAGSYRRFKRAVRAGPWGSEELSFPGITSDGSASCFASPSDGCISADDSYSD